MEELTFEVETITPLFIAGIDQRNCIRGIKSTKVVNME